MSFTPGIPRSGQSLGNSRPQVQGNFDYINTAFAINHVAFNASGVGKHKFMQMPEQVSAPTTLANEGALYTKEAQSITNLFWRQESNGTEVQLTGIAPLAAGNGYSTLPGGMIIQWGSTGAVGSSLNVSYNITFPNSIFSTVITGTSANKAFRISANATNQFTVTPIDGGTSGSSIYWIAIGN